MNEIEIEKKTIQQENTPPLRGGKRVSLLVVDDSPYVLRSIRRILDSVPEIEVTTAMDGAEALELVERSAPDLALIDLQMPRTDGLETTRRIKQCAPETKVVTTSVHDHERLRDASKKSGAEAYFVKNRLYRSLLPALGARFPQLSVWIH